MKMMFFFNVREVVKIMIIVNIWFEMGYPGSISPFLGSNS